MELDELFEAIRAACSPRAWSQGVLLARSGELSATQDDDEIVVVLRSNAGLVSPSVSLWPDDVDWACDCAASEDGCAHSAAAVIALREALSRGDTVDSAPRERVARVGYRFTSAATGLEFHRVLVLDGEADVALEGTLASAQRGGVKVLATKADATVELILGTRRQGLLDPAVWPRLLKALGMARDLTLDGESIGASVAPVLPVAVLRDAPGGFSLKLEPDPEIRTVYGNGVVLVGSELRTLGQTGLSAREQEQLPHGRHYRYDEAGVLASEVLPALRRRIGVRVVTQRLPDGRSEPPRACVYVDRQGDSLSVLPSVVYGDPPLARVDGQRLVLLGDGAVPLRDTDAELRVVRRLHRELGLEPGRRVELSGAGALSFADKLRAWDGAVHGAALGQFFRVGGLTPRIEAGAGGVEVEFVAGDLAAIEGEEGTRRVSAQAVVQAWSAGQEWVSVEGGGFAELPVDWLSHHGERLASLLVAREMLRELGDEQALPAYLAPEVAAFCDEVGLPPPPSVQRIRENLQDKSVSFDPPAGLRAELRPYQREGVRWLALLRAAGLGALLADDMGLGKTVQVLAAIRQRTLAVVPTSVLANWAREAEKFRPDLRVHVYHGPKREFDELADLTITTYGVLRMDADALAERTWDMAVLDESQAIKNATSQIARAAFRLRADFRVGLTGTPVENRLDELWSQFRFLNPAMLGPLADFRRRVADPISAGEPGVAQRLRDRIRPFVLRRLKREVAQDLPPRTEMVLRCELSPDERAVYESILASTRRDIVERMARGASVMAVLEALLRLRQAACHAGLVPGQQAERSSKLDLLREVLDEAVSEGHKVLVFSQWTSLLDLVEPVLDEAGIGHDRLDGGTRDRQAVVDRFQSDDGAPVLLLSLKAGGTGLNLTAADLVILLDPWWNPAAEDQAADRAHRIGQDKPVFVYRLVAEDTVEERILALQEKKRGLSEAALGEGAHAMAVGRDELLELIG